MKISTQPPQHLSNHEVLTHLLAQKADQDRLRKTIANHALRNKVEMRAKFPLTKEREETPSTEGLPELSEEVQRAEDEADRRGYAEEVGWIQDEVIKYLCTDYNPTARQTSEGVAHLADSLQDHSLTKSEVLQICNLAPVSVVELYCIVEDPDTRYHPATHDALAAISDRVHSTLLNEPPEHLLPHIVKTERTSHNETHSDGANGDEVSPSEAAPLVSGQGDSAGKGKRAKGEVDEAIMEEEYVHEAEWGKDFEAGADAEVNEDMD